jgi:hypothetical protein
MFVKALCCGILLNSQVIITSSRVDVSLLATSLALNFCVGNIAASVAPMLSNLPEPTLSMIIVGYCIFGILIALSFKEEKNLQN